MHASAVTVFIMLDSIETSQVCFLMAEQFRGALRAAKKRIHYNFFSILVHVLLSGSPCPNTETVTPSFCTGASEGLELHFSTFLQRRKLNKPQNNLQKWCVLRRSEDLPGCFRKRAAKPTIFGPIRAQQMMYGRGAHGAAALAGVDWQGEPTPRRDGSLFSVSQATALSQHGESSIFSSSERKRQDRKRKKATKSLGTSRKNEASSPLLLTLAVLL